MHKLTFYPLDNADCCLINLANGKKILFDYAHMRCDGDQTDKRIDLPTALRNDLGKRNYYDVVAFTHLHEDHIKRSSEFFHLEYEKKYQGEGRIRINEMWVPAGAITEDKCEDEAKIIQAEARHRLREKKGIRVFSRPNRLREWLAKNGMTLEEVAHLIVDAGKLVPTFTLSNDEVEFFVHSPFARRLNANDIEDRNQDSIVVQATFSSGGVLTKVILAADTTYEAWTDIVDITRAKKNESRLEWDLMKLPHHCSYKSIGPERSTRTSPDKTPPVEQVKWLFEDRRQAGCRIICTSKPIPQKGTEDDECPQPPHREAANYYKEDALQSFCLSDRWLVTMEHPRESAPKPIVIKIDQYKTTLEKAFTGGVSSIVSKPAPRAGGSRW